MATYKKILIVKPSSLGDIVHSLALLNAIKRCYPDASIHWVISRNLVSLLQGNPMIEKVWIIDKDKWKTLSGIFRTIKELRSLAKRLKSAKFDLVIDLQGLFRSGVISRFTKAPTILGFREAREGSRFFYTQTVEGGKDVHAVDRYLEIARFLGCDTAEVRFPLAVDVDWDSVRKRFSLPDEYAVLVPGARWETKKWPYDRFATVASGLSIQSVIIGSRHDKEISYGISQLSKGKSIDVSGKTSLNELVSIIKHAQFMLTNDTGPMHIAAALNVPVYALFGPTSDVLTGPYGKEHKIFKADKDCSPCFKRSCKNVICMKEVSADLVLHYIRKDM